MTTEDEDPQFTGSGDESPPQPGEPYLVALGRRRASRQRRIFADQHFYAIPEVAERLKVKEELIRELIRRDQARSHLHGQLLEGAVSEPAGVADAACFEGLREGIRRRVMA